jgi:hypothetical protein
MLTKTREQLQLENELLTFYAKKAKEKTSQQQSFFTLSKNGSPVGSVWGRDFADAAGFAQETQKRNRKFDDFNRPVPGNVQFTTIKKLF